MRIEVLGPIQLRRQDGVLAEVPERKVRGLLAVLVTAQGDAVSADALVDYVWGDDLPGNPHRVLQAKLSQLRTALDEAATNETLSGRELLSRSPGGYSLSLEQHQCDAHQLRALIRQARELPAGQQRVPVLDDALQLWRGQAYAEFRDAHWLAAEVTSLSELRLEAVELLADSLLASGQHQEAVELAAPEASQHPTRESMAAVLLRAYAMAGRQPEALTTFERLRAHLAEQLGIDPSVEVQDLHLRLLRQDPELRRAPEPETPDQQTAPQRDLTRPWQAEAHQGSTPTTSPGASVPQTLYAPLPSYSSQFLGRASEVAEVLDLMDEHRVVTLLGLGGIGKTRLAVEASQQWSSASHHNFMPGEHNEKSEHGDVWFIDLTGLAPGVSWDAHPSHHRPTNGVAHELHGPDVDRIASTVAAAMGLAAARDDSGSALSRLVSALAETPGLLVLDNCEHVIDEAAAFVDQLLARVRYLHVLATSREPFALPGERRYSVPHLAAESAVDFFMERARAVDPGLSDSPEVRSAARELSLRLDGLPLALELAAARVATLSVVDLLERVTERLDLLSRPGRAAPRRQQTLRGMLEWSWELLDPPAQVLLRRLAVHPVNWAIATVEDICADEDMLPRSQIVETLSRLVERNLVAVVDDRSGRSFRLLETVATFAGEKLEAAGERSWMEAKHSRYYRNMSECAEQFLFGPHAHSWVQWLSQDREHLRHAFQSAVRHGSAEQALGLVLSTFWHRWMTGDVDDISEELAAAASLSGSGHGDGESFMAAQTQAYLLSVVLDSNTMCPQESSGHVGNVQRILTALQQFPADTSGDQARAEVQWFAATALLATAEYRKQGEALADEAINLLVASGRLNLAALAASIRDWHLMDVWSAPPRGLPGDHDAEAILREHQNSYGLSQVLGVAHLVAEERGETGRANALADEAWQLVHELELHAETSYWTVTRALQALRDGNHQRAIELIHQAQELARRLGYHYGITLAQATEAAWAVRADDPLRAQQLVESMPPQDRNYVSRQLRRIMGEDILPSPVANAEAKA